MSDNFNDPPPGMGDPWDKEISLRRAQFDGREFLRDATGRWFDEWGAELIPGEDGSLSVIPPTRAAWQTNSLSRWAEREIPTRDWLIEGWVPLGQVVGLYGLPGSRKSTLLLQWMIATVLGKGFGSCPALTQGPAYGLFCEDGEFEIARRARAILNRYQATFSDVKDCHAESLVNANLTEMVSFNRAGRMLTTPAWDKFIYDIRWIKPVIVCLDVIADFFGGSEINRNQVHNFLRLLDATAAQYRFALVFACHPSLSGINDKTFRSGSTAWEGKARARLILQDPSDSDDKGDLPNQSPRRTLTLVKANYAKSGDEMRLAVRDGVFIPEDLDPDIAAQKKRSPLDDAVAESTFLNRLREALDAGTTLSNYRQNPQYAATALSDPDLPFVVAEAAMKRLFKKRIIRFDSTKRGKNKWIFNDMQGERGGVD